MIVLELEVQSASFKIVERNTAVLGACSEVFHVFGDCDGSNLAFC